MKRYVLLEDKTIIDMNEKDETIGNVYFISKYGEVFHKILGCKGKPIKESDNLLDLLEDKDLVECGIEGNVIQYDYVIDQLFEYKNIVAIWKRQGDIMRRYEV